MKMITAVIKPFKLEEVREALAECGVTGFDGDRGQRFWAPKGHTELYRGAGIRGGLSAQGEGGGGGENRGRDRCVDAIVNVARTGKIGDGKIL